MVQALYLHIPFCKKRCSYCDFATSACCDGALMDAYADALCLQLRRASRAGLLGGVRTIYIGGGTPTHLGSRRLGSIVYLLSLSVNLENVVEFTVECNPESTDERMVKDLFALGVDRFSIGVQSFDDAVLRAFGRIHDAAGARTAIAAVAQRARNYSVDLICGGPGQDMASWEASLAQAVALGARHVSVYPLSLEEGTPLACSVEAGEWSGPSEDLQADMMLRAGQVLEAAGFSRYEVASYALPGFESRHNIAYWSGVEYLGLGAGAASMLGRESYSACCEAGIFAHGAHEAALFPGVQRIRVSASPDARGFAGSEGRPHVQAEFMSAREAVLEDTMLAFRQSAGLGAARAERAFAAVPELHGTIERLQTAGLVELSGGSYVPTERGWLMGNEIFGAIWGLA